MPVYFVKSRARQFAAKNLAFQPPHRSSIMRAAILIVVLSTFAALTAELPKNAATEDLAWVNKRIQQLQPRPEEKRFDQVAWAPDIVQAVRLAHESQRGVFYFTHDGRMGEGRC
jgi:hypothetical protein